MTPRFSPVDSALIANVNIVHILIEIRLFQRGKFLQFALESNPDVLPAVHWHSLIRLELVKITLFVSF